MPEEWRRCWFHRGTDVETEGPRRRGREHQEVIQGQVEAVTLQNVHLSPGHVLEGSQTFAAPLAPGG